MTRTLLDITDDLLAMDALIGEVDGDITGVENVFDEWFAELDKDLKGKVDNYCALMATMEGRAAIRHEESKRLYRLAKSDERNAEYLRSRLKGALELRGVSKLDTARYRIGIVKNGGAPPVVIDLVAQVPDEFCRIIPETKEADKEKLREALVAGQTIPGVHLGERGTRLSIR